MGRHRLPEAERIESFKRRLWSRVDKNGPLPAAHPELGPCWLWTGPHNDAGYGTITGPLGNRVYAHRAAFFVQHGRWPILFARNRCDVHACVKVVSDSHGPAHIFEDRLWEDERLDEVLAFKATNAQIRLLRRAAVESGRDFASWARATLLASVTY
jgi:hypothetical protein